MTSNFEFPPSRPENQPNQPPHQTHDEEHQTDHSSEPIERGTSSIRSQVSFSISVVRYSNVFTE